ncbi:ABC transporter ATP-binding protein [Cryptosporangium aurantiacum]|uniref:Iron complex transport system ATP-binding protein n=1 Tax=Cryptosporangium aurantiacum TaxID=134849 RepID=A0A1M7KEH0_9ACTN|nr:ABC transporter ATP-binding protein [Cryptosporangium aurantiacum]SHM63220.1 iron complex transport system ATP-binding protein [Cryptosporangium aurantiacum]
MNTRLWAEDLTLAYEERVVASELGVRIADGSFTVIVGPNACGKSTLLKALARVLKPASGTVYLDGKAISSYPSRDVAKQLGMLPQSPVVPNGIVVEDLVARGRFSHQRFLRQWSPEDEAAVADALRLTETTDLAERYVDELSGGQRQRVWLALALAQQTDILLLDEPTTFLDLAHQFEVLDLCADLHEQGRTIVAVLHDLNHACRYATELIVLKAGTVVASGPPAEVMTPSLVEDVFGVPCEVMDDPATGTPMIVPGSRVQRRGVTAAR